MVKKKRLAGNTANNETPLPPALLSWTTQRGQSGWHDCSHFLVNLLRFSIEKRVQSENFKLDLVSQFSTNSIFFKFCKACLFLLRPEAVPGTTSPKAFISPIIVFAKLLETPALSPRLLAVTDSLFAIFGCTPLLFGLSFRMERLFRRCRRLRSNWPQLPRFRRLLSVKFYPENSTNTPYYY